MITHKIACIGAGYWGKNGVKIQKKVSVYEGVTLEDDVFCGPSMVFTHVFTLAVPFGAWMNCVPR